MYIVQLTGGLGNQMFQYAFAKNLAMKNKAELKLDVSFYESYDWHEYSLKPFNIAEKFATKEECNRLINPHPFLSRISRRVFKKEFNHIVSETSMRFDRNMLSLKPSKYIKGYWQCEEYFSDIEQVVRDCFFIKIPPSPANDDLQKKINNSNSISLHIRRGNYVNIESVNKFHGTCSLEYYRTAVKYMENRIENPVFYIFSDDILWAKANLGFIKNVYFVNINDDKTDYEDIRLMQFCKHNIIANSTFSWWGAWLNTHPAKTVIAPGQWFANKELEEQTTDICPASWVRI